MSKMGKALLRWRKKQKRGAIMRPSTFSALEARARAGGARNPKAVAGKAYWRTAKAKFTRARRRKR